MTCRKSERIENAPGTNKVAGYRVNIQKSIAFVYVSNNKWNLK